ncbi:MAG: aspartate kinase [Synergistetes bacterium]|nr:aspartate kinase [Synergistota bacterium]MDK2870765.1 aspartate kinase [bacterium]
MLVVQKYGGSSVANLELIKNVAQRVKKTKEEGHDVIVVVSAMGKTTDELLKMAYSLSPSPPERELDMLASTGEQISIALLSIALHELGCPSISFTGAQAGIITDSFFTRARIIRMDTWKISEELSKGKVVIVAGFQGMNEKGEITTLGRGGSDTTAVALAAAMKADVCEIYTDVDGVYTADPRIVPEARLLKEITYDEMLEMAIAGAKVLQHRAVEFAKRFSVPLKVKSSFNYNEGTWVKEEISVERKGVVTGVTVDKKIAKVTLLGVPDIPGIAHKFTKALANSGINIDMIIQSEPRGGYNDISFTIPEGDFEKAITILKEMSDEIGAEGVTGDKGVAKVSIIGAGVCSNPEIPATMFGTLAENNINIELISTSEVRISCVIRESKADTAVRALHKAFRLEEE